jgi:hypothetical protein
MRFLRTNTATRITIGPFLDKTDGITPEVAITVTSEKLTLMVNNAGVPTLVLDTNPTASGGNNDMVHVSGDDAGFYDLELAAADLNYLGGAMLSLNDVSVHCPVFHEFMILPAMIYDSMVLGTDRLDVNVTHVADTAQTAGDIIGKIGTPAGASVSVDIAAIKAETAAITAKTANLPSDPADASDIAALFTSLNTKLGTPAGASMSVDIAAVKTDTAAIKPKTDSLTYTVAGVVDANIQRVNDVLVNGNGGAGTEWGP